VNDRLLIEVPAELVDAIAERVKAELLAELRGQAGSPWLSERDAAAYLGVSERTLQRRVARGRLRSTTLGRRRLFHRDDLDALPETATGEETAPTAPSRRRKA
jgi:excisionase family DNA binding protein